VAGKDDDTRGPAHPGKCASCGAASGDDQSYCLECGARRGPLPAAIAGQIASLLRRDRDLDEAEDGEAEELDAESPAPSDNFMPTPRAAAVAVMGMLALGVLLGSATSQLAQSAGLSSILLEAAPAPAAPAETEAAGTETAETPEAAESTATESSLPFIPEVEEPATATPPPKPPPELPEEEGLPPVKHVFVVMLGENGYEESFGPAAAAPYLARTLPEQGELLPNYYAVTKGDLANQIALLSGQGPTLETAADCPSYGDVTPATISTAPTAQVEGNGCVYPAATPTLPSQLVAAKKKWRAYVEDIGNGVATGQAASCRHPALGAPDPNQAPLPGDAYETWRNPFVYFHALIDKPECAENDVGLDRLATDLKSAKKTPALSYIVPNACHDGGEAPCVPGEVAGAAETEIFLQTVIPEIVASPAYKEGGLIAIASSQAPQGAKQPDTSSCCISPAYPNLPPAPPAEPSTGPVKPVGGGGKVGLLLISPFVEPGSIDETAYFNHFSLLLTIEELFGLEKLGYAKEEALLPFDSSVFNAAS
jgi:hypothetical protein